MYEEDRIGVYYKCLSGANAHFALAEEHSFAVEDPLGRSWICYPVRREVVEDFDLLADLPEIDRADEALGEGERTDVRLVFCEDAAELREKLGEPPASE